MAQQRRMPGLSLYRDGVTTPRPTPGSQASLRDANRARLVDAVKHHGGLTQVELAGATGLSPATVHNIVRELSDSGVLTTSASKRSGRRATFVTLARGLGLVAGVHVGSRHLRVSIADAAYKVITEHHMPLAPNHRADNELGRTSQLIADMLDAVDASASELTAVGVAVSAPINRRTGSVSRSGIMPGWDDVPIARRLERALNVPVFVDNDSNLAALAEFRMGAAREHPDSIFVSASYGIGAGILVDGRIQRGHHGGAGEIGHTTLDEDGPLCRCGNHGCVEVFAGGNALIKALRTSDRGLKLGDIVTRALAGESLYVRAIADAGRRIGAATADLCNIVDPEIVVVGGELSRAGEILLAPMRHRLERTLLVDAERTPEVVQGVLGERAAEMGAVAFAIDSVGVNSNSPALRR